MKGAYFIKKNKEEKKKKKVFLLAIGCLFLFLNSSVNAQKKFEWRKFETVEDDTGRVFAQCIVPGETCRV
jgi:hypothetical protein